jgi:hypothetical protein
VFTKIVRFETDVFRSSFLEVLFNPQQHATTMTKESSLLLSEILLRIDKIEEEQTSHSQLIQELRVNSVPKSKTSKNKQTKRVKRISVNTQIIDLLMKEPAKVWTSDELAEKIGCTGAAVRKTAVWKGYQKQKAKAKQQCSIRKGFKDKNDNIVVPSEDNEIDD